MGIGVEGRVVDVRGRRPRLVSDATEYLLFTAMSVTLQCMQWNESYATGIPHLDQQHQALFKAVAAMAAALATDDGASEFERLLEFLSRYCREHFADEEGCMERYRCPSANKNKQQHEGLLRMLAEHQRFLSAHGYDPHDAQMLVTSMEHWLHSHLRGVDRELRHCVKASRS